MVEWAGLENQCGRTVTEGSNPSLSAINLLIVSGRGSSSVGRAPGSQSGGRGFDPHLLHQILPESIYKNKNRVLGRARWGGSGALYPQSAIAGLNSRPEVLVSQVRSEQSSAEDRILRNKELLNPVRTGR